jgi:hypothetical protein
MLQLGESYSADLCLIEGASGYGCQPKIHPHSSYDGAQTDVKLPIKIELKALSHVKREIPGIWMRVQKIQIVLLYTC